MAQYGTNYIDHGPWQNSLENRNYLFKSVDDECNEFSRNQSGASE